MARDLYLAVEKPRQYRLIASPNQEDLLQLLCESAMPNNTLERTVMHSGPRLAAASASWPAAELGLRAKARDLTHLRSVYTLRICGFPGAKGSVVST
jgi:hypothetical protein